MRLYLECAMGASGDMLMSALYELLPDKAAFRTKMEALNLPGVTLEYGTAEKCGVTGTHITVKVNGETEHSEDVTRHEHNHGHTKHAKHGKQGKHTHSGRRYNYTEIRSLIRTLGLPDNVMADALCVYRLLGEAEAKVHGVTLEELHLHEVGSLDAVTDVAGCCLLINMLGVSDVIASPVHVGSGSVRCEHGILPVPAPAAAELLLGVPIYGGDIKGELCTPTGAALLKHFVGRFGDMPEMTVSKIGIGMGTKDFSAANCLRAFLCEDDLFEEESRDTILEISCNLDDMTPEAVSAAFDILLDEGAADVYITPIQMKKNRPGVKLSCLCRPDERDKFTKLMLEHTTTLGVRLSACRRNIMARFTETVTTKYGDIRIKHAAGCGIEKQKPEYEDVLSAAKEYGVPLATVYDEVNRTAR